MVYEYPVPQELDLQCQAVVDRLISEHDWRLLSRHAVLLRTIEHLRSGVADRPESAAVGAYCIALHAACSGMEGPQRQNRAYQELGRYLYCLIGMRFIDLPADVREDVAQSALERIFRAFEHCREPIAFLAFAAQHLLDAVRVARRQQYRPVESFDQIRDADDDPAEALPDPQPHPLDDILNTERRAAIERLLAEFAADHPRASQQVAILRMTWLDDLDDAAISQRLAMSLGSVYTARSRVIKTLQSEPKWQARARALGLMFGEV